jgi:putative FmdB family regulatory protein
MPLYEYECAACAHRFERIQKFSDPLVDVCPECGGAVRKLLSSPAIQFKGSGFYITDYARQGKGGGSTDSSSSSKSDGGDKGDKDRKETTKEDKKSESADKASSSSDSNSKSESKPASGS